MPPQFQGHNVVIVWPPWLFNFGTSRDQYKACHEFELSLPINLTRFAKFDALFVIHIESYYSKRSAILLKNPNQALTIQVLFQNHFIWFVKESTKIDMRVAKNGVKYLEYPFRLLKVKQESKAWEQLLVNFWIIVIIPTQWIIELQTSNHRIRLTPLPVLCIRYRWRETL